LQFQTLCESSQLYDPGTQYTEFVKRLPTSLVSHKDPAQSPFSFEPYSKGINKLLDQERKSTDSVESEDLFRGKLCNLKIRITLRSNFALYVLKYRVVFEVPYRFSLHATLFYMTVA
jgi:hypothetical protein